MNAKEFIELYSSFYGEKVDNLQQITVCNYTGEELFDFVKYVVDSPLRQTLIGGVDLGKGDDKGVKAVVIGSGKQPYTEEQIEQMLRAYDNGCGVILVQEQKGAEGIKEALEHIKENPLGLTPLHNFEPFIDALPRRGSNGSWRKYV